MLRTALASVMLTGCLVAGPALAAGQKIAVVVPQDGPFTLIGKQVLDGATFAAAGHDTEIVPVAESCEAGGDANLATSIISAGATAAIGFLCTESLEATLPALGEAGIPAITLSVRSDILMEDALKKGWPLFRLAPSARAEAEKIAEVITERWKSVSFALIDDGTIHGRELVEAVRLKLEAIGMKPVFTDTYRPAQEQQISLVRRLSKTGATHVLVGGDRNDVSVMARDAAAERIGLTIMGGDALDAANQPVPLADGVLAVTLPPYEASGEGRTVADEMLKAGLVAEGYVLPAHAAVSVIEKAGEAGEPLKDALLKGPFRTVLGAISFNATHELSQNPYQLLEWRGNGFVPAPPRTETE